MKFIETNNIKGDIFGGVTAGIVALPLALAFGIQAFGGVDSPNAASLGALAGIVGATMLGFFASLFGGTHSQISGPTGPMTVVTATLIAGAWASSNGNLGAVLFSMSLAGIFCGLFQILFGIIKIGKYVRYIPYPVLSGFMSGIGIIIIIQQIYPLLGLKGKGSMIELLTGLPTALSGGISISALLLGIGTILIIELFPLITKKIPATLVALIVMTVISLFCNLDQKLIIGEIPSGLPLPVFLKGEIDMASIEWMSVLKAALIPGLTLAGLGSIDTLLTSVVADNITKTKHNSNKELIGQGIGNAVAGLFCGLPGAGATMRTVVNVKSGGRTQLSGMIHALILLAILLGLGSVVKYVPLSVLAGILITVGWGIIDFKGFKDLFKIPKADAVVLVVVLLVTVFVDLLTAVGIGMVIACVLLQALGRRGWPHRRDAQADICPTPQRPHLLWLHHQVQRGYGRCPSRCQGSHHPHEAGQLHGPVRPLRHGNRHQRNPVPWHLGADDHHPAPTNVYAQNTQRHSRRRSRRTYLQNLRIVHYVLERT